MNLNKILKTLAEHEKLLQESTSINKQISECINSCSLPVDDGLITEYGTIRATDEKRKDKTHLWYAFRETNDGPYSQHLLSHEEITDYLDEEECHHCITAWRLIQDRKELRKRLGIAKRNIRIYGKQAIKQLENDNE